MRCAAIEEGPMPQLLRRSLFLSGLALVSLVPPALAQETMRVRGTIERMDGPAYIVKDRGGKEWKGRPERKAAVRGHGQGQHE
jgi:hypothetical protein